MIQEEKEEEREKTPSGSDLLGPSSGGKRIRSATRHKSRSPVPVEAMLGDDEKSQHQAFIKKSVLKVDRLRRVELEDRTEHLDKLDLKDEDNKMSFCKKDFLQREPVMRDFHQPMMQQAQEK